MPTVFANKFFAPRPVRTCEKLQPALLRRLIQKLSISDQSPVILCIGTDRIIGDSLGPMVGTLLKKAVSDRLPVYGTLQDTVHALNIDYLKLYVKKKHPGSIVIAVDASLGSFEQVGSVYVRPGCLYPGAGVRKKLSAVGDITITGITNGESSQPYLDLQTARLSTVAAMADTICDYILEACLP